MIEPAPDQNGTSTTHLDWFYYRVMKSKNSRIFQRGFLAKYWLAGESPEDWSSDIIVCFYSAVLLLVHSDGVFLVFDVSELA